MRTSLIISGLLHLFFFAVIFLNFSPGKKMEIAEPQPLPVDIMTPAEFSEMKQGKKDAKPEDPNSKPKAEKKPEGAPKSIEKVQPSNDPAKTLAAAAPPPPSAPPPEVEKKPEPKPEPPKPPEAKPEVAPKPEPEKKPEVAEKPEPEKKPEPPKPKKVVEEKPKPKPKPEQKREFNQDRIADLLRKTPETDAKPREFNPNRISALLNKDPTAGTPSDNPNKVERGRPPSSFEDQMAGVEQASGTRMSMSEIDMFRQQISRCWSPPIGGIGSSAMNVRVRFQLNRDGSLSGPPRVLNNEPSPNFQAAADATVRAVIQCQPYQLPPDKYSEWAENTFNFNPSQM